MPVTLVRVLIFVFGLSYGCGLIRSLILRQRHRTASVVLGAIESRLCQGFPVTQPWPLVSQSGWPRPEPER